MLAGFERQAESRPHRLVLELGRRQLSYGELAERTLAFALELRGRGVGVDTRVGLCVERGVDLMVGLLGILRAGAAYVALDPALPSERLRFLLEDSSPPIGRPTAGARVRVLSPGLRSCPIGVPGELCIGGVSPARGYARRPRLTAERFVPDPRGLGRGARLYRTGDLTRLLADGRIEYLGRIDQQVKIRGYRVEPGEIEAALTELPEIREAAVRPRRGASGVTSLAAYVVAVGEAPDWTSVRERLRDWLPDYMVPGLLLALDALPLTTSGKIDGRALAALSAAAPGPSRRPPVTSTERALAAVWSELLEFDEIGRDDDFFELGGHSLLATQVISRIRLDFGVELPLRVLFEAATLRRLAEQLDFTVVTLDRLGSVPVEEGEYEEFEIA